MLEDLLQSCGLHERESEVFLYLARRGALPAASIARGLKMKRPSVYFVLDNLAERGLVTRRKVRGVAYFAVADINHIPKLLDERARSNYDSVRRAALALPRLLAEILPARAVFEEKGYEIEAFESMEAVYLAVEESLKAGEYFGIWDPQVGAVGRGRQIALGFLHRTGQAKTRVLEIAVNGPVAQWYVENITNPCHQVRMLPAGTEMPVEFGIVQGAVMIACYTEGQELALRIRHQPLYEGLKGVFNLLWASLEHPGLD